MEAKALSESDYMVYIHAILNKTLAISNIAHREFSEHGKGALCMLLSADKADIKEFKYFPLSDVSFYETRPNLREAIELSTQPKYILLTTECNDGPPLDFILKISNPYVLNLFRLSL